MNLDRRFLCGVRNFIATRREVANRLKVPITSLEQTKVETADKVLLPNCEAQHEIVAAVVRRKYKVLVQSSPDSIIFRKRLIII